MERFWIVLRDKPTLQATLRHKSRESAVEEAKRLATAHTGERFFVAAITGMACYNPIPVIWTELKSPGNCYYESR